MAAPAAGAGGAAAERGGGSGAAWRRGRPGDRAEAPRTAVARDRAHRPTVSGLHDLPRASRHAATRGARRAPERTHRRLAQRWRAAPAVPPHGIVPGTGQPTVRQSRPMRPGAGRPSQVRPRPPSTGRPAPTKARPEPRPRHALAAHRRVERSRGLPLPFRLLLVVAVVASARRRCGRRRRRRPGRRRARRGLGGFVDDVATPSPAAAGCPVARRRADDRAPDEPYTNEPRSTSSVNVPAAVAGIDGNRIRIYVAIGDGRPVVAEDPGRADVRARRPGVDAEPRAATTSRRRSSGPAASPTRRAVVTYVLDQSKPRSCELARGRRSSTQGRQIEGKTQAGSDVRIANDVNGAIVDGAADEDGMFDVDCRSSPGTNDDHVTATDPAGNATDRRSRCARARASSVHAVGVGLPVQASKLPEQRAR